MIIKNLDEIGKIVRDHRKKSGLSQVQCAQIAGVGKTVMFDVEKGKTTIKIDTLFRILQALNIKIELISPIIDYGQEGNDA
jgi:y4mF family transcriptional regulator